jgi:hypothetical protein
MDATERALVAKAVGDAIAGVATTEPIAVDAALAEVGWRDMLDAEPEVAVEVVFRALGTTNASATALDDLLARALGLEPDDTFAVLLPSFGAWTAPGRIRRDSVEASGLTGARAKSAEQILVVCESEEPRAVTIPMSSVDIATAAGVDSDAAVHRVHVRAEATVVSALDPGAWDTAIALGRRAVAQQIAGAAGAMVELARVHALERVQFGRPVARFQAVRHRLAEAHVAVEALDAALAAAADSPTPETAALAKAIAGRTARTVATHCQQVLAGIGFTTDHPFHRYLKRTMVLDGLLGSADAIVLDTGRRLLATRAVPRLIEL